MKRVTAAYLQCAHCGCEFLGSFQQMKRSRMKTIHRSYCSTICQHAGEGERKRKPIPQRGPCPTCHKHFFSRGLKEYCTMKCYTSSRKFLDMIRANSAKGRAVRIMNLTGKAPQPSVEIECIECGKKQIVKASKKRTKYCSHRCYRLYMAKRFDRWIANPEAIALPQAYDEFMLQQELPCLVEGCNWFGQNLGNHVNFTHGITAREFKRAAGFNLKTGLVTMDVHEKMSERQVKLLQQMAENGAPLLMRPPMHPVAVKEYVSKEALEHYAKGMALYRAQASGRDLQCIGCGMEFRSGPMGKGAKYCSLACRDRAYRRKGQRKIYPLTCFCCGRTFDGKRNQQLRSEKELGVACSAHCKGVVNARKAVAARRALEARKLELAK